ncbi:hypothetical protein GGR92_000468 [Spirosoma lacussanchae]|uniref:DUF3179 domain-containing (seleno)protein n=1 Tax=Spirosoma lacussanchae TaxID=1884249 RepID=UPI001108B3A9|nr:DUF3179 domain-containing (seleno)protein [Spirosoma lacussanchae]
MANLPVRDESEHTGPTPALQQPVTPRLAKTLVGFVCLLLGLIGLEAARVYFIMPFPGSQLDDTANLDRVKITYWLHQYGSWLRGAGIVVILVLAYQLLFKSNRIGYRWLIGSSAIAYGAVLYMVNSKMMADQMFRQPIHKLIVPLEQNKIPLNKLVLGYAANGKATAYPLQLIGYHHQVRDTVGGMPIMVTYCTVCRTGRVFSPLVRGQADEFRLVGMDHFNAMFEDSRTGSWWRQATGEAIVGPMRGEILPGLTAQQMTLGEWAVSHPNTRVLQADSTFADEFAAMKNYDKGLSKGKLTRRDSASWKPKSWVIGVQQGVVAKAYDWNLLQEKRVINDVVGGEPLVLMMAPDSASFGVWDRRTGGRSLNFRYANRRLTDLETQSVWTWRGHCIAGPLAGQQLGSIPKAYQEFWHSWQSFHPQTKRYNLKH